MAQHTLAASMDHVFEDEGGFVDHPQDNGGPTNLGITLATLESFFGRKVSVTELKRLTRATATTIYKTRYWDAVRGDELPAGVDYVAFDAAVHSGPKAGIKLIQRAIGASADGIVGPVTLRLLRAADPATVVSAAIDQRLAFLRKLEDWETFRNGWTARLERVEARALEMIGARAANPHSTIMPPHRPRQSAAQTEAILADHRHRFPSNMRDVAVRVLAVRGYYPGSFGGAGNDRGVYDDALFVLIGDRLVPFNANLDPSVYRRRVASLQAPQVVLYKPGPHGYARPDGPYPAFRQHSDVTVMRDGLGIDTDDPGRRFWINLHRGGERGTSSLGCITVPPHQWDEFRELITAGLAEAGQEVFPVLVLEYSGNDVPAPRAAQRSQHGDVPSDQVIAEKLREVADRSGAPDTVDRLPRPPRRPRMDPERDPPRRSPPDEPFSEEKFAYQSKTVVAAFVGLVALGLSAAGVDLSDPSLGWLQDKLNEAIAGLAFAYTLFGRTKARTKIRWWPFRGRDD